MFAEQLSDFSAPWCQALLTSPDLIDITTPARRTKHFRNSVTANPLISTTFRSESTIRAWKSLRTANIEDPTSVSPTFLLLLSLGSGLGGWTDTLHGGVFGVIIDQSNSICVQAMASPPNMTAEMNLRYRKRVPLPSVVLCRSVMTKREGKKSWVRCTVEDGAGGVFCEADALWISTAQGKL